MANAPAAPASAAAPDLPLSKNRDFLFVFGGQGISALGDSVSFTTLPLLVLALTGSGLMMGVVGVLSEIPDLFFGLPSGVLADRWDRRRMMLYADFGRAILIGLIPLAALLGLPVMGVVLLVAFPINVCRVLFMSAWTGAVPNLVARRQLGRAVSLFEAVQSTSFIIGPAVAGVLVGIIGPAETLAIDALSFAASGASLVFVRRRLQAAERPEPRPVMREIRDGIDFIVHHRSLRLAVGYWTAFSIITAAHIAVTTFYVRIDRGLDATWVGLVLAAEGAGTLVGALIGGRLAHGRLAPPLLAGALIQAAALSLLSLPTPPLALPAAGMLLGLGWGMFVVSYLTFRASVTPDHLLGRVGSTARTISIGLSPIGFFVGGVLLDVIGGTDTMRLMALLVVIVTVLFGSAASLRSARIELRE